MKIYFTKNKGYTALNINGSSFRGYIQTDNDNKVMRGEEALKYFASSESFDDFIGRLRACDGCFSVAVTKGARVWAAVDKARSMPIYYASDLSMISDSGELIRREKCIAPEDTDPIRMLELFVSRFVAHCRTVYDDISQVELGHAIEISEGRLKDAPYFIHTNARREMTRDEAMTLLEEETDRMITRMLEVVNGRPIVISLSGGYDSRFLACSLKRYGVNNVACYTYGGGGSFEIPYAKRVADALGYKWHFVEYTPSDQKALIPELAGDYLDYCNEHDYGAYLQNFTAMKKLHEAHAIPDDAVMITGLCHDSPSGVYIPSRAGAEAYGLDTDGAIQHILNKRFRRTYRQRKLGFSAITQQVEEQITQELRDSITSLGLDVQDWQTFNGVLDSIQTGYEHSRCYLNMNKVHEFFGHEWLLPCWDKGLLKFWYSMPVELRYKQSLYEEYVTGRLGSRFGLTHKKLLTQSRSSLKEFKRLAGRFFSVYLLRLGRALGITLTKDINCFDVLDVKLCGLLRQKEALKFNGTDLLTVLTAYLMEQRYGTNWFSRISPYLRRRR